MVSSQRIPQTSTTAGSSAAQVNVKAVLNRKIKGAQEQLRSKTSYNARQILTLQQQPQSNHGGQAMNKTGYNNRSANTKSHTLQIVDSKKQQRAEQVYHNINNLLEN